MSDIANLIIRVDSDGVRTAGDRLDGLAGQARGAGASIGAMARKLAGIAAATVGVGASVRILADYEDAMAGVAAVMQPTAGQLAQIRDLTQDLGANTEFTAAQAAEGMRFLGQAGFEAADAMAALPVALDLATAGSLGLGASADILSNLS